MAEQGVSRYYKRGPRGGVITTLKGGYSALNLSLDINLESETAQELYIAGLRQVWGHITINCPDTGCN